MSKDVVMCDAYQSTPFGTGSIGLTAARRFKRLRVVGMDAFDTEPGKVVRFARKVLGSSLSTAKRPPQAPSPTPEGQAISLCTMSFTLSRLPNQNVKGTLRCIRVLWWEKPYGSSAFDTLGFYDVESKRLARGILVEHLVPNQQVKNP